MTSSSTAEQVCRQFSLGEIQLATGDFSDAHVIGKGGFGKVYKGLIDDGSLIVAVKRLASNSKQGEQEFVTELETLSKLRHRNLVSLIGYCKEQGEMILVYEYMPNGTLADHLHRNSDHGSSLTWNERLRICIGAGRGLDYLHTGSSVIHRDVKPTNILLDENYTAKVSDFGLAKHLSVDSLESHVSASVKGSFGYFDPFYFISGRLTKASDTYAFGVVLLEVLSGRPAIDGKLAEGELCLTLWAQDKIRTNRKFQEIVASSLRAEISYDCLKTFVGVVKRCLLHEPKKRLSMTQVVAQLELALEQQDRKGPTRKLQLRGFWNRAIPSGDTQKDNNGVEVKMPVEEELQSKQCSVDVSVDHELENEQYLRVVFGETAIQLSEMKDITDDFGPKCWIANGCTGGSIFHGVLKTGQDAAIKMLYMKLPSLEFAEQVWLLSRLKHENVTELLGYCVDGGEQVLVYEFAKRGSLHDILHGRQDPKGLALEPGPALSWAQRVDIAVGAAKGLLYFHDNSLIHRNIKSTNVLLFDDGIAKITDSHLSFECPCERENIFGDRAISRCHDNHPPEYGMAGFSQEGDVYNYGVVLLELLTGRKSLGGQDIVKWATPMLGEHNVHNIVDARLQGDYPHKAVARMAAVVGLCVEHDADYRPSMDTVLKVLHSITRETQDYLLNQSKPCPKIMTPGDNDCPGLLWFYPSCEEPLQQETESVAQGHA